MIIQQIRSATQRIEYAGKTFLVDPWLCDRGGLGTFRQLGGVFRCAPEHQDIPMPVCDLPFPREEILRNVDAYICTHVHPDHIDMAPDGTVGRYLEKHLPVFVQSMEDAHVFVRSGFENVTVMYEDSGLEDVRIVSVPARHGTKIPCGPACGVVLQHPDEKTLYLAGDTVWYSAVAKTISKWQPGVITVNACAATLLDEGRLIMDDADVENVLWAADGAQIVVSHMDNVAHATISRPEMSRRLAERGIRERILMPEDGESLIF